MNIIVVLSLLKVTSKYYKFGSEITSAVFWRLGGAHFANGDCDEVESYTHLLRPCDKFIHYCL